MKKMIIRSIAILLIVLGAIKAYACMGVVVGICPIVFEHGMTSLGSRVASLHLGMVAISLAKVVGGFGLLWLKPWAKWTAAVAALAHVLFLTYFGIPIWIQMINGTIDSPADLPMWREFVTIAVNLVIAVMVLACMRQSKESRGTTTNSTLSAGPPKRELHVGVTRNMDCGTKWSIGGHTSLNSEEHWTGGMAHEIKVTFIHTYDSNSCELFCPSAEPVSGNRSKRE
jgi:hypothetical protein